MRYLTLAEIVNLHFLIAKATGGASGIRDLGALESAIAQPKATFDGKDLYFHHLQRRQLFFVPPFPGTPICRRQLEDRTCCDGNISSAKWR